MTRLAMYLLGGYLRPIPPMGVMYFLTRRGAARYRSTFFGAIDPYARNMGPIRPVPGRLIRKNLRRNTPHQPDDTCFGDHCYSHHVDEPAVNAHTVCGECFHVFPTARALRRDHRRLLISMVRSDPWAWTSGDGWREPSWKAVRRILAVRADQIWTCPHCAHDL